MRWGVHLLHLRWRLLLLLYQLHLHWHLWSRWNSVLRLADPVHGAASVRLSIVINLLLTTRWSTTSSSWGQHHVLLAGVDRVRTTARVG